ncbi:MAG: I78 family peptidase inhibitor [Planktotalea sp.]|uniref:I78 family peptidase inhibitor n=1 Tax=Planktotalea sp. TaxID=2029877 RepID=UPI003C72716A
MKRFCILLVVALAACVPAKEQHSNSPETCPKSQFSNLIGTDINAAVLPLTLTYRTIWPGDVVTTDHLPDRMNIAVDDAGLVQNLSCG